ncbi:hypothetical protein [Tessaracoccus coleopterorum]|nr:hypothetical protein [Tessaracoccus coleopterorum]
MARAGVDEVVTRRTHAWRSTLLVNVLGSLVLGVASATVPVPG